MPRHRSGHGGGIDAEVEEGPRNGAAACVGEIVIHAPAPSPVEGRHEGAVKENEICHSPRVVNKPYARGRPNVYAGLESPGLGTPLARRPGRPRTGGLSLPAERGENNFAVARTETGYVELHSVQYHPGYTFFINARRHYGFQCTPRSQKCN